MRNGLTDRRLAEWLKYQTHRPVRRGDGPRIRLERLGSLTLGPERSSRTEKGVVNAISSHYKHVEKHAQCLMGADH